jgi:hypothetical protein
MTSFTPVKNTTIYSTFEEIAKMSKFGFKKILKEKSQIAACKYLNNETPKQTKILDINYSELKMQVYQFIVNSFI